MKKNKSQIEYEKRMLSRAKEINIDNLSICYNCKNQLEEEELECPKCSFPQKGTKIQMSEFLLIKKKQTEVEKFTEERKTKTTMLPFVYFILLIICFTISFPFLMRGGNSGALAAVIIILVPIFSARIIRNIIFNNLVKNKPKKNLIYIFITFLFLSISSSLFYIFVLGLTPEEKPFPKPKSYYRIDYPDKNYIPLLKNGNNSPYLFERPSYTQVAKIPGSPEGDMVLVFPELKADLIIKYLKIDTSFNSLTEKVKSDAYYHSFKANAIDEKVFSNPNSNIYGVTYEITGNSACNYLFYLSDSVNHMITGELLIQSKPNYDSLQPTIDFIKSDIVHLIETFEWNN